MPVKLTSVTGDINITAGDLNVQSEHTGANFDSIRIGDGTNLLGVNASLEALVHDADALVELQAILAKIIAAPATEAKQDTMISNQGLQLVELQAILAKIIAAPSTEAKQDTIISSLASLLAELQLKADLLETQPVSLASQPLPTGAATEVTLASILSQLSAIEDVITADNSKRVIHSYYGASPTIPTASRLATVVVPASTKAVELEILTKTGDNFTAYDLAAGGTVLGRFTQAGGKIPVQLFAGTTVYLQSDTGSNIAASDLTINLIGVSI